MSMQKGFKRAVFSESTAAQFTVITPRVGKRIRVRGLFLTAVGVQLATLEADAVSMGAIHLSAGNAVVLPTTEGGTGEAWMETAIDESLNITLGQAVQTDGVIFYDEA